ncbi:hypothetical protein, partial [Escherichia coli]|uniref:hypothetical protein n=1 Tax=Escherichia coli TaxID=562 RepID=UPI001BDB7B5A
IETPFSHIPAAFVVALRNPATKVESMAIFLPPANLQWISPAGFLFSSMHNIAFTSIPSIVISMLYRCSGDIGGLRQPVLCSCSL